jgi:hypothetical protein
MGGFVVDKAALGQVFFQFLGFPCRAFHRMPHAHHHPGHLALSVNIRLDFPDLFKMY